MRKEKNDLSSRFIEAIDYLIAKNKASNSTELASKVGISTSMITEIRKGRSSVGTKALQNIVSDFEIDATWLLTGKGEMLGQSTEKTSQNDKLLFNYLIEKDKKIEDLTTENALLKEKIKRLPEQESESKIRTGISDYINVDEENYSHLKSTKKSKH